MKYYIYSTKTKKEERVSKKAIEQMLTKEIYDYCCKHFDSNEDETFDDYFNWEIDKISDMISFCSSVQVNDFIFSIDR